MLKRKEYLIEAPQQVKETPIEPSVEEIVAAIKDNKMSLEELEAAHQNGEISDETFTEVTQILTEEENQKVIKQLVTQLNSGEITTDDIDKALANGEITEDIYTAVMQQMTDDPNMDDSQQPVENQEEPQAIVAPFDNVRLFDHFIALKEYISTYKSAYNDIEIDQLTKFQVERLAGLYSRLRQLETDLIFYLNNSFKNEEYKKNLYTYLLFNKQFADEIGKFRHVLNLDPKNIMPEEKDDKNKKKS